MPVTRLISLMCEDSSGVNRLDLTPKNEPINLWRNSLVMLGLFVAHIIINHRLGSFRVAGIGSSSLCDAFSIFAGISILFIVVGSLFRMSSGRHSSSDLRYLYAVRAQLAVLFAIFITFMAEIIALARNLTM